MAAILGEEPVIKLSTRKGTVFLIGPAFSTHLNRMLCVALSRLRPKSPQTKLYENFPKIRRGNKLKRVRFEFSAVLPVHLSKSLRRSIWRQVYGKTPILNPKRAKRFKIYANVHKIPNPRTKSFKIYANVEKIPSTRAELNF